MVVSGAIAPAAPGQQPVAFQDMAQQNRPRSGSVDLDAPPPPKPKKRTKRNKVEYNTGDRIRVVEHAKYQGRLGTVVKRTVAWVEVHLDSLQPGEKELTASFRKKDLVLLNDAGDAALTEAALPPPPPPAPAPAPSPAAADKVDDDDDEEAEAAPAPVSTPGAPIRVRTAGGREAIVLEKMQRGWFRVELDQNANDEGGAGERKSMRMPHGFAPGQDHLLDAAPQAAVVPKPKGSSSKGRKSVQQTVPGPVPVGAVQAITAGGRVATILERKQRGWFAVELDGNANDEGGAFERKSMRRPMFAPGQDSVLDSAPDAMPYAPPHYYHAPPPPGVPVAQPAALPGAAQGAPNAMSPADMAAAFAQFQQFQQFLQMRGALPPQS